ncbi:ScbR family autoregulator-binding transcription factor [Streptomyces sp. NPDC058417]|uniref:ScbR family autoregulator-binding transcription factor n=1 Tax=unclassified Streptomyces TaxID=2593676 RepID=UPI00364B219F
MATQERAIRKRRAILEAAGAIFDEHGYDAAAITMVVERAQVTKGALYFHFSSKEALAQAVLNEQVPFGTVPAQPCKLQEVIDMTFMVAYGLQTNALLRGSVRLTVDQNTPPGVDHSGPFRQWPERLIALMEQAREQGELLPTVKTQDTVDLLVGAFAGIQVMSRALTNRQDLADRISALWTHILPAIAAPSLLLRLEANVERAERVTASPGLTAS